MKQQRTHQQDAARSHSTNMLGSVLAHTFNLAFRNPATQMRSGNDPQRAILGPTIIKVKSYRDHLLQNGGGRLDMLNTSLNGPWTKTLYLDPLSHSDRHILMPRHLPVRIGYLVEQNSSDWQKGISQNRFNIMSDKSGSSKTAHLWAYVKQISYRENATSLTNRSNLVNPYKRIDESPNKLFRKKAFADSEALLLYSSFRSGRIILVIKFAELFEPSFGDELVSDTASFTDETPEILLGRFFFQLIRLQGLSLFTQKHRNVYRPLLPLNRHQGLQSIGLHQTLEKIDEVTATLTHAIGQPSVEALRLIERAVTALLIFP